MTHDEARAFALEGLDYLARLPGVWMFPYRRAGIAQARQMALYNDTVITEYVSFNSVHPITEYLEMATKKKPQAFDPAAILAKLEQLVTEFPALAGAVMTLIQILTALAAVPPPPSEKLKGAVLAGKCPDDCCADMCACIDAALEAELTSVAHLICLHACCQAPST